MTPRPPLASVRSPQSHRRWTHTDLTQLRGRVHAGGLAGQIAEELGRSLLDVERMMIRMRLHAVLR